MNDRILSRLTGGGGFIAYVCVSFRGQGMLKKKLNQVLADRPQSVVKPDFSAQQAIREKIKARLSLPLIEFCRTRAEFDAKHGLVYKLLKTTPSRLNDSTLCSHDVNYWLRDHKQPLAALWIIKLAGNEAGKVSRNQLLKWLRENRDTNDMLKVYQWTKKWGFQDSEHTRTILASPETVNEARTLYREAKHLNSTSRQMLANKLLNELIKNTRDPSSEWIQDVYKLFRTFNKDLVTFQIMLGGMIRHAGLRQYCNEVWELVLRQHQANNIVIDDKLRETHERVKRLMK